MQEFKTLREVCVLLNVSRRAVQGYEKAGLVKPSGKNKYGYLLYDESAMDMIGKIKQLQTFGFQIKEIQELMVAPNEIVREELQKKIVVLEAKRTELGNAISDAKALLEELNQGK